MAQLGVDERAPGVSNAMRQRIGNLLDAGDRPTLRGNLLRIGNVVLGRADGRDAPAAAEVTLQMQRRGLDTVGAFTTYGPAPPTQLLSYP